jgi:hypothetical protein
MPRRKKLIALLIVIAVVVALAVVGGYWTPGLVLTLIEQRLADFAAERELALSYSSAESAPFSASFTFSDFCLNSPSPPNPFSIEIPQMSLSVSLWRYLFGSGYSYLTIDATSPVVVLRAAQTGAFTPVPPISADTKSVISETAAEQKSTSDNSQNPSTANQQQPQLSPQNVPSAPPQTTETLQMADDEYPTINISDGKVYLANPNGLAVLLSELSGTFGPQVELTFHPLGLPDATGTLQGSPSSLVLPQLQLPAEKLKSVLFPALRVDFGSCSATVGGVWSLSGQGSLDFLVEGPRIGISRLGGEISGVSLQAVYDGKGLQMLWSDFDWGGGHWKGEGWIADFSGGEMSFRFLCPVVSFNKIKQLVGGNAGGQFYLVGEGTMEIDIQGTLAKPKTSFKFQKL